MKWIFFSYSLPANPSKARVYAWRQLKKMGAVNQQNVWIVPHAADRIRELEKLTETIEKYKGSALLMVGTVPVKRQEENVVKALAASRDEEYVEVIEQCEAFFKEIEYEIGRENFIFAEVEENEEELEKLKAWFKKIEKRDTVKAPLRKAALQKIKQCERIFNDFAKRVYDHQQT
jgi:hypothetical protein